MAITPPVAKRLWGKAGGRCSICKEELIAIGSEVLLGEMAHIVARSPDGPRGNQPNAPADRDAYENLILLCPTHHREIDGSPGEWTVERLQGQKTQHEGWVRARLEAGELAPVEVDSSSFREARVRVWTEEPGSWSYTALTPLEIVEESLDPLRTEAPALIGALELPAPLNLLLGRNPSQYHVAPSEHGLLAEDFRKRAQGGAYRLEVFRNGHAEYVVSASSTSQDGSAKELKNLSPFKRPAGLSDHRRRDFRRYLLWERWSKLLLSQLQVLHRLWHDIPLPTHYMVLSALTTRVKGATVGVEGRDRYSWWVGAPFESDNFHFSSVVEKGADLQTMAAPILRRFANSAGLELEPAFEASGDVGKPKSFSFGT